MNLNQIIDFYVKNALYQSKHDYRDKITNLAWFFSYEKITIDTITEYCINRKIQGVKNSTINRELTVLRSALNYYSKHHDDYDKKNPFNGFRLFEQDFIPRFLNLSECRKLLKSALAYDNQNLHDFVVIALNTGCRSGELLSLTWDNVYIDDGYFIIRNSLSKNKKTVYKPINKQTKQALERLKIHHKWVFYNPKTDNRIRSFRRGFQYAVERANLGHVRIHDLRHTFASLLVKQGVPLYHVSTLLGHSDIRITQKYAHLEPNHLLNIIATLPKIG